MATDSRNGKMSMKLLIDKRSHKVLFAEITKEVVDFLVGIHSLPMATISSALDPDDRTISGCTAKIYSSFKSLDQDFIAQELDMINLFPEMKVPGPAVLSPYPKKFYRSIYCSCGSFCNESGTICPKCRLPMTTEMTYVGSNMHGYVKESVVYMIADDLTIAPLTVDSVISLLRGFNAEDICNHEHKTVDLGPEERLKILVTSFRSREVLSDVFGSGKKIKQDAVDGSSVRQSARKKG